MQPQFQICRYMQLVSRGGRIPRWLNFARGKRHAFPSSPFVKHVSSAAPLPKQNQLPTISFLRKLFSSGSTLSPATMSAAKTKTQQIIDDNAVGTSLTPKLLNHLTRVAVFSKSYCPYCRATKSLLTEMGAKPYIIELDQVGTALP